MASVESGLQACPPIFLFSIVQGLSWLRFGSGVEPGFIGVPALVVEPHSHIKRKGSEAFSSVNPCLNSSIRNRIV